MLIKRLANTRGNPRLKTISSFRTFSFPGWFNPAYRNFSDLQTINDDRVEPDWHVPEHTHSNMEIFGYVVSGKCRHTDSLGNVFDVPAGAVQRMSTGTGIRHTEGNAGTEPCRYLQLWVRPNQQDVTPHWSWHQFSREDKLNKFCNITEKLPIYADARLLAGIFQDSYTYKLEDNRCYYLYVVSGAGQINGERYTEGDGFSFENESTIRIDPDQESEIIVFDLAAK